MRKPWDITPEDAQKEMEFLQTNRDEADHEAAHLLRRQLTHGIQRDDFRDTVVPLRPGIAFADHETIELEFADAAGIADFANRQELPEDWFPGYEVALHFVKDDALDWCVYRTGFRRTFGLRFWATDGSLLGELPRVGDLPVELPVTSASQLSYIELYLPDAGNR